MAHNKITTRNKTDKFILIKSYVFMFHLFSCGFYSLPKSKAHPNLHNWSWNLVLHDLRAEAFWKFNVRD